VNEIAKVREALLHIANATITSGKIVQRDQVRLMLRADMIFYTHVG
jgi:hypothetical protein